jgi:PAS domain S-box-containing protein
MNSSDISESGEISESNRGSARDRKKEEEAEAYLAAIVESSDDAIVSKTLKGIITSWNKSAERIFGYQASEIIGQPVNVLIPADRQTEEDEILEKLKRGERVEHFETIRVRKNGTPVNISLTISPIRNYEGEIVGASKIAREITEQKRLEAEQERLLAREKAARARAEEASRLKDEFLAVVSHELRTPLNGILGWVRILRTDDLDSATTERALETIERNAKAQAEIIDDILDVSRIVTGTLRLDIQGIDLPSIIQSTIELIMPAAHAKGILFRSMFDPQIGTTSGDPRRIQQVVWNLLSNAIKFTPREGRVGVELKRNDQEIEITVSDTGIGIRPEFLPYVFDRFRQADSSPSRQYGGLGLGLSIVRHLVELHGGSVSVESPGEGQGAVFKVSLPIMVTPPEQITLSRKAPAASDIGLSEQACDLSGIKVLVVDVEVDDREVLVCLLTRYGAEVKTASSIDEMLGTVQEWRPDVMVFDMGMPPEDGYTLIRKVRGLGAGQGGEIPAIALTAHAKAEDRLKVLSAGYQMQVAKPVDPIELTIVIRSLAGWIETK